MSNYHKLILPPVIAFAPMTEPRQGGKYITLYSEEKLKKRLATALEIENYEAAVLYRNELRRREALK